MPAYLIETSTIINYLRGREDTVKLVDSLEGDITSSYVCLAELYEGVYRVRERTHARQAVTQFFSSLSMVFGLTADIAQEFGRLRATLKRHAQLIEDLNLLIAATCLANNLILITENNKHFARLKQLTIYAAS